MAWDVDDLEGNTPVTTYTITITADDDSAATTRLRLDTCADQGILTDLHLHDTQGLSAGQLPAIDYGLLLRGGQPLRVVQVQVGQDPLVSARVQAQPGRGGAVIVGGD